MYIMPELTRTVDDAGFQALLMEQLVQRVAIVQLRAYYTSVSAWSQTEFPINNVNVRRILIQARAT